MTLRIKSVWAYFAAALLLCSALPSAAATYVSGRLLTRDTQQPIPGATISLLPPVDAPASFGHSAADTPALAIAQTLANGSFVLSAPGAGSYRILVHKAEYPELEQSLIVPEAGLSGLVLSIVPPPTAHILVLDPAGKPVTKGAAVVWMLVAPLSGVM